MGLITLQSTNPDFSYILKKNPEGMMQVSNVKLGTAYGWYDNPQMFVGYFRDALNEISFKEDYLTHDFEYMDTTRYASPAIPLTLNADYFHHIINKPEEKDIEGFDNTYTINLLECKVSYISLFKKYFPDFILEEKTISGRFVTVKVSTKKSIRELLCYVNVFCLYNSIRSGKYVQYTEMFKYIKALNMLDAPYFIRYVFKVNLSSMAGRFKEVKADLEKSTRYKIELVSGRTQDNRLEWVRSLVNLKKDIVDIGCGEGHYVSRVASKQTDALYHAVDINPDCIESVKKVVAKKQLEHVITYTKLEDVPENKDATALLIEVIEHMSIDEAKIIVQEALTKFGKVILTSPNKSFNEYYEFDEEQTRHDDHKFEFVRSEFEQFCFSVCPKGQVRFYDLGDKVNGEPTSFGAVLC